MGTCRATLVAALLASAAARAQSVDVEPETNWYGWQTALAQLLPLAPSVVHLAHDHPAAALGSLGLHLALPIAGGFVGAWTIGGHCGRDSGELCGLGPIVAGMGFGYLAAAIIDVVALSDEPRDRPHRVAFQVDPRSRTAGFGLRF